MAASQTDRAEAVGCYGLRLDGIADARRYVGPVADDAPVVTVVRRGPAAARDAYEIDDAHAILPLSDGGSWASLDRSTGTVELMLRKPYADDELLHPLLSGSCALVNWWHGRDAFHGGAFVIDGRAWVVIGDKGFGKSTLLGHLAEQGFPILTDDLVVEHEGNVLPGPAFVDLRPDAARHTGMGRDMGMLGARPRFRLDVVPTSAAPLAGWISLTWGDETKLVPMPLAARLPRLFANRAVLLQPASPRAFTGYAGLPFYELQRPKQWTSLDAVVDLLTSTLG